MGRIGKIQSGGLGGGKVRGKKKEKKREEGWGKRNRGRGPKEGRGQTQGGDELEEVVLIKYKNILVPWVSGIRDKGFGFFVCFFQL